VAIRQEANGDHRRHVASREVDRLLDELFVEDEFRRETAIVRLRLIGERAIGRLAAIIGGAPTQVRVAALRALEGGPSPRIADLALSALTTGDDPAVAEAAVRVLAPWVQCEQGTRLLDALLGLVMNPATDTRVAAAAREALATLPPSLVQSILSPPAVSNAGASIDPASITDWLAGPGRDGSVPEVNRLVEQVSTRERLAGSDDERQRWMAARGRLHAHLARVGSRVALVDLRETFERATRPLPPDFLVAVSAIGDAACLEALARAWSAAPDEPWWRTRVSETGSAVMLRLGLTGRHAAVRKLRTRYPGFASPRR